MKKNAARIICLLLVVILALGFAAGCGKKDAGENGAGRESGNGSEANDDISLEDLPSGGPYVIKDEVLVDGAECSFTVVGAAYDESRGFILRVRCENKTAEQNLMFSLEDVCINGSSADPLWSYEVGAGEASVDDVIFSADTFGRIGASEAQEVSFALMVYDSDDWFSDYIVSQKFSVYPTGLDAGSVDRPARRTEEGEKIILDDENVLFVIYGVKEDSFWGPTLDCCIENKTGDSLSFSWDNVSVNGNVLDVYWLESVSAGARCYRELVIDDAEFEDYGITEIENVGFDLTVGYTNGLEDDVLIEQTFTYAP